MIMFMAFHATAARKPILIAASISLVMLGLGLALSFG